MTTTNQTVTLLADRMHPIVGNRVIAAIKSSDLQGAAFAEDWWGTRYSRESIDKFGRGLWRNENGDAFTAAEVTCGACGKWTSRPHKCFDGQYTIRPEVSVA
jgi:hypothetical protein